MKSGKIATREIFVKPSSGYLDNFQFSVTTLVEY